MSWIQWIGCALVVLLAQPAWAEPIANVGFEDGVVDPWFQGSGTIDYPHEELWSVTTSFANSGAWSATNVGNNELRQDFAPVSTALIDEISFFLRKEGVPGLEGMAIQLHYLNAFRTQIVIFVSEFDHWEKHDVTSSLAHGEQLVGISAFGQRSEVLNRTYVDDFVISVPEPGVELLAATAMAVLAAVARRRMRVIRPTAKLSNTGL